ncbi:hypothetical protein CYMTET_19878, partial [Cymbomonas tetramitiformis]
MDPDFGNDLFERSLRTSSPTERALVWTSIVSLINTPGFTDVPKQIQDVCKCICGTAVRYWDKRSRLIVLRAVEEGCKYDAFIKTLASIIVQSVEKGNLSDPGQSFALLSWSCILLKNLDFSPSNKIIPRLMPIVASLTDNARTRSALSINKVFFKLFRDKPEAVDFFLKYIRDSSEGYKHLILFKPVFEFCAQTKGQDNREELMGLYIQAVLSAKTAPPSAAVEAFLPLVKSLSAEEFMEKIFPVVVKMMKRSPEAVAGSAVALFSSQTAHDMSKCIPEILPSLLQLIRNAEEARRDSAASIITSLAKQCSNFDTIESAVDAIQAILKGSEGRLAQVHQRLGMMQSLSCLCAVPGRGKAVSRVAAKAAEVVATFYKSE